MRRANLLPWVLPGLLALQSCDRTIDSTEDQPLVNYVLIVTDSATKAPLDSVRIRVTGIGGDTATYITDRFEGRAEARTLASSRTWFSLSKDGFRTLDIIDTVNEKPDTVFNRPILRILRVAMPREGSSRPVVDSLPRDTLSPGDTLKFRFSRPVVFRDVITVRLTNISNQLFVTSALSDSGKTLRVWQRDDRWVPGRRYDYELVLRDALGAVFTRPGDTMPRITGFFHVRDTAGADTSVVYPRNLRLAFFNSGDFSRFDSLHVATSPKPDSTTRFARLKWNWTKPQGRKVDTVLVLIRDGGAAAPSWLVWTAIPGFADSATLDFAELYSTSNAPSQKPTFPLRLSSTAEIFLRVLPKHGGKILDSLDTALATIRQGMGPSLFVDYEDRKLNDTVDAADSLEVVFLSRETDSSSAFDFGSTRPTPLLFLSDQRDSTVLSWKWLSGTRGRLTYNFRGRGNPPANTTFRVDLNGVPYQGKPIWQRNRQLRVLLP